MKHLRLCVPWAQHSPDAPKKPSYNEWMERHIECLCLCLCLGLCMGNCQHFKADKSRVKRGKAKKYICMSMCVWGRLSIHLCVCQCVCVNVVADTWGKILKIHEHAERTWRGGNWTLDLQTLADCLLELQVAYLPYDKCSLECHDCQRGT